jgi:hypothetical protein
MINEVRLAEVLFQVTQLAYIKLIPSSEFSEITIEQLKELLLHYCQQLELTAKQLGWEYDKAGFPYQIESKPSSDGKWFYLKGTNPLYKYIAFGIGIEQKDDQNQFIIQVMLPDEATHGDKAKGNEFCKYLGKTLKAELQLFNGRTMYFNPRK